MSTLALDWFTSGMLDVEYKQYILLAYLKSVEEQFSQSLLYPPLSELVAHRDALQAYVSHRDGLRQQFPKQLMGFDAKSLKPIYADTVSPEGEESLDAVNEIVAFALPRLEDALAEGKQLHELVEQELRLEPVGVSPLYQQEGYLFIRPGKQDLVQTYRYNVSTFAVADEKLVGIHTQYVTSFYTGVSQSYPQMKLELIRQYPELPNPATWAAESGLHFPVLQTLLPVLKRQLLRRVIHP